MRRSLLYVFILFCVGIVSYPFAAFSQQLSVSPLSLNFGRTSPTVPVELCVTVVNVGTDSLIFDSTLITGPGAEMYSVVSIPDTLGAGDTSTYCILFDPTSSGLFTATLTIYSNGIDSGIQSVSLTATSELPTMEIIPLGDNSTDKLFRFTRVPLGDTVVQRFVIKNISPGFLRLSDSTYISGLYAHYYTLLSSFPTSPLDSGETDTITVQFVPLREGLASAKIHLVSNADNDSLVMDLVGVGIVPRLEVLPSNSLSFGFHLLNDTTCETLQLRNPGSDTVRITAQYFTHNDGDFEFHPLMGADTAIPPGATREITVCYNAIWGGARVAGIRIMTNIPMTYEPIDGIDDGDYDGGEEEYFRRDSSSIHIGISGIGIAYGKLASVVLSNKSIFDSVNVGTQKCMTVDLVNIGDADITVTDISLAGATTNEFTIDSIATPFVMGPKSSMTFNVCVTPTTGGSRSVNINVSGVAVVNEEEVITSFSTLWDVYGKVYCGTVTPDTLFANVITTVGSSDTATVLVANCGDLPNTFTAMMASDSNYSLVAPTTSGAIPAEGTHIFQVVFHPTSRGLKEGSMTISRTNQPDVVITLLGVGGCAVPFGPASFEAPATIVGDTTYFRIKVTNLGNITWNSGPAFITPAGVFDVVLDSSDTEIAPDADGFVLVRYTPKNAGMDTALLLFPNAGPCQEIDRTTILYGRADSTSTSVRTADIPEGYTLSQNHPNPAAGMTSFRFEVPKESSVRIVLADITGKIVKEVTSGRYSSGEHQITISTSDLSSGTYLYVLDVNGYRLMRQMVVGK